jgi:hypothetical protein
VGLAHRGAWPGPANEFGPLTPFGKTGEAKAGGLPTDSDWPTAGCRGRSGRCPCQSLGEAYWGGSDREAAHQSLAPDGDGGRRRGAPVRGRRSGGNPELKRCRCTLGWSGAHGGMDRAGRWPERPLSVSSWRNGGGGEWAMGARGSG